MCYISQDLPSNDHQFSQLRREEKTFGQEFTKIQNGVTADPMDWTFLVQIGIQHVWHDTISGSSGNYPNDGVYPAIYPNSQCHGIIIGENWVLTNEFCCGSINTVSSSTFRNFVLQFGATKTHWPVDYATGELDWQMNQLGAMYGDSIFTLKPTQFWLQNEGVIDSTSTTMPGDGFCLIRTEENIYELASANQMNLKVPCLPTETETNFPQDGEFCWVGGWGEQQDAQQYTTSYPVDLRSAVIPNLDPNYCSSHSMNDWPIESEETMCLAHPDLNNDGYLDNRGRPCGLDTGGPIICWNQNNGSMTLAGIVNNSNYCYPDITNNSNVDDLQTMVPVGGKKLSPSMNWVNSIVAENTPADGFDYVPDVMPELNTCNSYTPGGALDYFINQELISDAVQINEGHRRFTARLNIIRDTTSFNTANYVDASSLTDTLIEYCQATILDGKNVLTAAECCTPNYATGTVLPDNAKWLPEYQVKVQIETGFDLDRQFTTSAVPCTRNTGDIYLNPRNHAIRDGFCIIHIDDTGIRADNPFDIFKATVLHSSYDPDASPNEFVHNQVCFDAVAAPCIGTNPSHPDTNIELFNQGEQDISTLANSNIVNSFNEPTSPPHGRRCWVGQRKIGDSQEYNSIGVNIFDDEYCNSHSIEGMISPANWTPGPGANFCAGKPDKDNNGFLDGTANCNTDVTQDQSHFAAPIICDIDGTATLMGIFDYFHDHNHRGDCITINPFDTDGGVVSEYRSISSSTAHWMKTVLLFFNNESTESSENLKVQFESSIFELESSKLDLKSDLLIDQGFTVYDNESSWRLYPAAQCPANDLRKRREFNEYDYDDLGMKKNKDKKKKKKHQQSASVESERTVTAGKTVNVTVTAEQPTGARPSFIAVEEEKTVGGNPTTTENIFLPYVVNLGFNSDASTISDNWGILTDETIIERNCMGTVIDDRWIMTSAACCDGMEAVAVGVAMPYISGYESTPPVLSIDNPILKVPNEWGISWDSTDGPYGYNSPTGFVSTKIIYNGGNIVMHPDYDRSNEANGLCLLQTDVEMHFGDSNECGTVTNWKTFGTNKKSCTQPVCPALEAPAHGQDCFVITYAVHDQMYPEQYRVGMNAMSDEYCEGNMHWDLPPLSQYKTNDQICAGVPNWAGTLLDSDHVTNGWPTNTNYGVLCSNDNDGSSGMSMGAQPLMCRYGDGEFILSGIAVEKEIECEKYLNTNGLWDMVSAPPGQPNIFTSVANHHSWIQEIINPVTTTAPPTTTTAPPTTTTADPNVTTTPRPEFMPLTDTIDTGMATCSGTQRIVGGQEAQQNSWPWIVHVGMQNAAIEGTSAYYACGGSIIHKNWIVTAAHCCIGMTKFRLTFGQHDRFAADTGEWTIEVTEVENNVFLHPEYIGHENNQLNDICLIRANHQGVNIDDIFALGAVAAGCDGNCMAAACLPTEQPTHGDACWVAGWGTTEESGSTAQILQEVGVNIMSGDYCTNYTYLNNYDMHQPEYLCAGLPDTNGDNITEAGKDSCQGDSGGPLICNVDGFATLVGVVSWGIGCAREGYPGIYANTFQMKSWINNVIDSNGTDNSVPPTEEPTGGDNGTDDMPDTYQACDTCTSDQQAGLNRHNELRCLHGAQMMTATDEMNAYAQAFAEELAAADTMYHSSELGTLKQGENIFWASGHSTPDYVMATQKWYDEFITPGYDWDLPDTMANWQSGAGHFTQVVWNSSTELGMGHAFSASGALFIVARYKSRGNMVGQFGANVFQLAADVTAESCAIPANVSDNNTSGEDSATDDTTNDDATAGDDSATNTNQSCAHCSSDQQSGPGLEIIWSESRSEPKFLGPLVWSVFS